MEIHNTTEDLVIAEVNSICDSLEAEGKSAVTGGGSICTCDQCRQDAVCYVLNNTAPHYVVSHRGAVRVDQGNAQERADLAAIAYEAIKRVSHNQRPYVTHGKNAEAGVTTPVFNIPTIMGRVFDGRNFSPMANIEAELLQNGSLVAMKDQNWQNPFRIIANTNGTFTFWPRTVPADTAGKRASFEYTLRIAETDYAELVYVFTIPVVSEVASAGSFSMERTFKLPDLYLFRPGEEKDQLNIVTDHECPE
ncbi:MAG: late competence development ComFB family protein [Treponema sp.]|jgi:competence protein ComFB|nr:late competence development ComFB family protein [Treponema sp.]